MFFPSLRQFQVVERPNLECGERSERWFSLCISCLTAFVFFFFAGRGVWLSLGCFHHKNLVVACLKKYHNGKMVKVEWEIALGFKKEPFELMPQWD